MRCAPLAIHNRMLELDEMRGKLAAFRGSRRKAQKEKAAAIQAEIDAIHAAASSWPESRAEISYGVPTPCGKRVSHYMSKIDGVWVRHE